MTDKYVKHQEKWLEDMWLRIGDEVIILTAAKDSMHGWENVWIPEMTETIDQKGTIKDISERGIRLSPQSYEYPYFCLEPAYREFKVGDKVKIIAGKEADTQDLVMPEMEKKIGMKLKVVSTNPSYSTSIKLENGYWYPKPCLLILATTQEEYNDITERYHKAGYRTRNLDTLKEKPKSKFTRAYNAFSSVTVDMLPRNLRTPPFLDPVMFKEEPPKGVADMKSTFLIAGQKTPPEPKDCPHPERLGVWACKGKGYTLRWHDNMYILQNMKTKLTSRHHDWSPESYPANRMNVLASDWEQIEQAPKETIAGERLLRPKKTYPFKTPVDPYNIG